MSILNEVRRLADSRVAEPMSRYVELVAHVYLEAEVDPQDVLDTLDAVGKTVDSLEADVVVYSEFVKLQAKTDPDMLDRLQRESDAKFDAMQKACAAKDAAEAELKRLASEELTAGNVASRASSIATDARNAANQARQAMEQERFTLFREYASAELVANAD